MVEKILSDFDLVLIRKVYKIVLFNTYIMKKRFVLGLLVFLILLLIVQITLAAGNITAKEKVAPTENDCIYYFYGDGCERSEEHTSELQSQFHLVCRLLLEKNR